MICASFNEDFRVNHILIELNINELQCVSLNREYLPCTVFHSAYIFFEAPAVMKHTIKIIIGIIDIF